jgi:hypothetical protein
MAPPANEVPTRGADDLGLLSAPLKYRYNTVTVLEPEPKGEEELLQTCPQRSNKPSLSAAFQYHNNSFLSRA